MTPPLIIDGKAVAAALRTQLRARIAAAACSPGLAVVLVGADPASQVYVQSKSKAALEVGVTPFDFRLDVTTSEGELLALIARLNDDARVHGILIQMPLPRHIRTEVVLAAIAPAKDVDGLHACNLGALAQGRPRFVPCTPRGIMHLLAHAKVALAGRRAVVLGRSVLVGKPMALLLGNANATVTVCHSQTRELEAEVRRAEIVIAAIGKPEFVRGGWLADGAVVIDVGINRMADKRLVGDVAYAEALPRVAAITPVPGGVGPMTIACLLENTVDAALGVASV